jgi:hypothetical protein
MGGVNLGRCFLYVLLKQLWSIQHIQQIKCMDARNIGAGAEALSKIADDLFKNTFEQK